MSESRESLGRAETAPDARPSLASLTDSTGRAFREVYQERLGTMFQVFFFIGLVIHLSFGAYSIAVGISPLFVIFHGAWLIIATVGIGWRVMRGAPRSLITLRIFDAAIAVGLVTVAASVPLSSSPDDAARFPLAAMTTFATILFIFMRAAIVPSTWWYSLILHSFVCLPSVICSIVIPTHFPWLEWGLLPFTFQLVWFSIYVIVSAAISNVIWRLRARARVADQLGQYRLVEKIGEGGMGVVYRARHAMLRRDTAVKLLKPEIAGEQAILRFEREVRHTAQLTHPNTVSIHDYGRTPEGVFYYAMELLGGLNLKRLVETDGAQAPERVVHILLQVCGALAEAHGLGLVHRDVKPANIIVCQRGGVDDVVKVVDFGLVKSTNTDATSSDPKLTGVTQIVGTPQYLPPEAIADGQAQDARSDLYSLGATAFFLLTGEELFPGTSIVAICAKHLEAAPDSPSDRLGESVGDDLDEVILRCLAKDPAERWQSAKDLGEALESCNAAGHWTRKHAAEWWREHPETPPEIEGGQSSESLAIDLHGRHAHLEAGA